MNKLLKEIVELELKLSSKGTRGDEEILNELLDKKFFEFGVSGTELSRDIIVDYLLKYGNSEKSKSFDFEGKLLSEDVFLLTYKAEQYHEDETVKSLRSSIWSKSSGTWKMIFHQGTKRNEE